MFCADVRKERGGRGVLFKVGSWAFGGMWVNKVRGDPGVKLVSNRFECQANRGD